MKSSLDTLEQIQRYSRKHRIELARLMASLDNQSLMREERAKLVARYMEVAKLVTLPVEDFMLEVDKL